MNLDRLVANTQAIRAAAASSLPASPFTRAILHTPLGDLIRDIEPAELGLFTPQLARTEFHGPAPRKKQDPEVYAQAALSYIERYHSIRPMPRAYAEVVTMLDQLAATRDSIRALTLALEHIQSSELKPRADQEERRVQQLQAKLADLKQRKDVTVAQSKPRKCSEHSEALVPPSPSTPIQSPSKFDETFHTPAAAARTLRFTNNLLMDEEVDLADVSTASPERAGSFANHTGNDRAEEAVEPLDAPPEQDDEIIVLPEPSVNPSMAPVPACVTETPKKGKLRVNSEVERIVAKIWSTAGDIIMPGHPFDASGTGTGNKPPRAKETIAHLQSVAALTPTPASPSTTISSISAPAPTGPTPQQVLTAHLLLELLGSGPQYSMPLSKVKEALAAKASTSGGTGLVLGGQSTTRVLYGCVAKRLVKIERGGGEQIVKFDV
ncbi:hypothetical protein GGX14DRAFT_451835 [Mycena pura]|uniref:Uncharacterized protein n=1 Tax=Mycena pura TaxID=153505 RepID=A0AAD6YEV0_9AGAR|nr:hypothetical protein GGX14DRAFT_451835 [Mycena pura]